MSALAVAVLFTAATFVLIVGALVLDPPTPRPQPQRRTCLCDHGTVRDITPAGRHISYPCPRCKEAAA